MCMHHHSDDFLHFTVYKKTFWIHETYFETICYF